MKKITSPVVENAHLKGNFYVSVSESVDIHGFLTGSLFLQKGSEINIFGVVNGDITVNGARLRIFGTVIGKLVTFNNAMVTKEGGHILAVENLIV